MLLPSDWPRRSIRVVRLTKAEYDVGVLYSVWPLDSKARRGLAATGITDLPSYDGRNPTPAELRSVLSALRGFRITFNDPPALDKAWQAMVEDASAAEQAGWTLLNISQYMGEHEPSAIWFEKGWPDLIVTILVQVAAVSGPLCLVADTGDPPLVIRGGDDPAELLNRWEHTTSRDQATE